MSPLLLKRFGWSLIIMAPIMFLDSAVAVGVFIALGSLLVNQAQTAEESKVKQSLSCLDSCVKAFEEARSLLIDGNNERATWIAAGRVLMLAKEFSNGIAVPSHLRLLELQKLKYRASFYAALRQPASFFYGVDATLPLDEAAKASTAREEYDGRIITSTHHELSEKSLYAVWEAAQWGKDYKDPLDTAFSLEQSSKLVILFPGLGKFLEHKSQYHSAAGVLKKRQK